MRTSIESLVIGCGVVGLHVSGVVAAKPEAATKLKAADSVPIPAEPATGTPDPVVPLNLDPAASTPAAPDAPVGAPLDMSSLTYKISGFDLEYVAGGKEDAKGLPKVSRLMKLPVSLGVVKGIYREAGVGKQETIELKDVNKTKVFSASALQAITVVLAKELSSSGVSGVFLAPDPKQIDPSAGTDLRTKGERLKLLIYVGIVSEIRTVAKGPKNKPANPINAPINARIAKNSPIKVGDLLEQPKLQEYLTRINRFPARRVDAAASASGEPGGINLDYLVREDKQWFNYVQVSNTGTKESGEVRTQLGTVVRQLARLDDVLTAEYSAADFAKSNSFTLSYELAPIFPDVLKVRTYGSYVDFTADGVGFDNLKFTGDTTTVGLTLTYTPIVYRGFFVDLLLGTAWRNVKINNPLAGTRGSSDFFVPYFGIALSKDREWYHTSASLRLDTNIASIADTQSSDLPQMGRFNTSKDFSILRWDLSQSFYLEPLLNNAAWMEGKDWKKARLANELAFSTKGQFALDNRRLVPQYEDVIGGIDTVRGYPQSFAAGDSSIMGSTEYRLHFPRLLRPSSVPQSSGQEAVPVNGPANQNTRFQFAARPPAIMARPDWDLILRSFVDAGAVHNNDINRTSESNRTLVGAGLGLELQVSRYVNFRCDWGVALRSVKDPNTSKPVESGDGRVNLQATVTW